jgi:hypothetical protein
MAYSDEQKNKMFDEICLRISKGEALRNILNEKEMLSNTVFYEMLKNENKNEQYARACEIRADKIFDEILEISDKQDSDVIIGEDGNQYINHNIINRNRLQVDARKWILSKMNPKKYGDKLDLNLETKKPILYKNVSKQFPNE